MEQLFSSINPQSRVNRYSQYTRIAILLLYCSYCFTFNFIFQQSRSFLFLWHKRIFKIHFLIIHSFSLPLSLYFSFSPTVLIYMNNDLRASLPVDKTDKRRVKVYLRVARRAKDK